MGRLTSITLSLCHLVLLTVARDLSASDRSFSDNSKVEAPSKSAWLPADSIRALNNAQDSMSPDQVKKWDDFAVWGKRDSDSDAIESSIPPWHMLGERAKLWADRNLDTSKRWHEMAVWGKRSHPPGLDKKWHEMAVWGKRFDNPYKARNLEAIKKWNEISLWGKRMSTNQQHPVQRNVQGPPSLEKANLEVVAPLWGPPMGDSRQEFPVMEGSSEPHLARVSRQQQNFPNKLKLARARLRYNQLMEKRPTWSDTGLTSWGKRSNPDVDSTDLLSA